MQRESVAQRDAAAPSGVAMRKSMLNQPRSAIQSRVKEPRLTQLLAHLAAERGLAENSLHAYRRDLESLSDFLSPRKRTLFSADARDYREYLHAQSRGGKSTRTVARRLAAIRVMLRFFSGENGESANILQQLERPKPEQSLPKTLSRTQVNQLISAPNPKSSQYSRDVAILELLYASGLRASELCSLELRDLNSSVGVVRVLGKGSKERIVPVGGAARQAIERYLTECRPKLLRNFDEHLFLSRTGKPLDRIALWMLVEKYGRRSGIMREVSPHTLRHCFATHLLGGGSGFARRAGAIGAQRYQHDADLHARGPGPAQGRAPKVSSARIKFPPRKRFPLMCDNPR
jgi:integrase/recombinase XerD